MIRKSLDVSGRTPGPLRSLLEDLAAIAQGARIEFFVVGATARDLILEIGHGITTGRMTQVGSSRVDLQACKLEYSIVSPK